MLSGFVLTSSAGCSACTQPAPGKEDAHLRLRLMAAERAEWRWDEGAELVLLLGQSQQESGS